jgi:copper homeostasis protein CutC
MYVPWGCMQPLRVAAVVFGAAPMQVCNDPIRALQICIELGVSRVLSSGQVSCLRFTCCPVMDHFVTVLPQAATALEGAAMLATMVRIAGDKVNVVGKYVAASVSWKWHAVSCCVPSALCLRVEASDLTTFAS